MKLFDMTTMPLDVAVNWDPKTILGQALTDEPWLRIVESDKLLWLDQMNSKHNENTFVFKMLDFECFMLVYIRHHEVYSRVVHLKDFKRFCEGPIFEGPYNWPDIRS